MPRNTPQQYCSSHTNTPWYFSDYDLYISKDEEIRRDFDGKFYKKDEFEEYYGGLKEWNQCSSKKWRKRVLLLYAMKEDLPKDVKHILAEVLSEI